MIPEDEAFPAKREEREKERGRDEKEMAGEGRRRRGNRTRLTGRCQTMFGCPASTVSVGLTQGK